MKCPYCNNNLELHAEREADENIYTIECHSCAAAWEEVKEESYW